MFFKQRANDGKGLYRVSVVTEGAKLAPLSREVAYSI